MLCKSILDSHRAIAVRDDLDCDVNVVLRIFKPFFTSKAIKGSAIGL